jgi:hypothetical protein
MIAKYNHVVGGWRLFVAWQVATMVNLALLLGDVNFLDGSVKKNQRAYTVNKNPHHPVF